VIILDTHIWIWWVHGVARLTESQITCLRDNEAHGLGVSAISCWEVAKLVELGRLNLPCPVLDWLHLALAFPGIRLLELTPAVAAESAQLPPGFHRDPADQIIVATARVYDCPLVTVDKQIQSYPHVKIVR
jgi:PIN domain nuclease of toxin-antitoxin system